MFYHILFFLSLLIRQLDACTNLKIPLQLLLCLVLTPALHVSNSTLSLIVCFHNFSYIALSFLAVCSFVFNNYHHQLQGLGLLACSHLSVRRIDLFHLIGCRHFSLLSLGWQFTIFRGIR
jgi:hypothetical protein